MWIHPLRPRDLGESQRAPGEVPNYANRLLWAIWAFIIGSAVFLGLRIYCKLSRSRALWWDDRLLAASWVRLSLFLYYWRSVSC